MCIFFTCVVYVSGREREREREMLFEVSLFVGFRLWGLGFLRCLGLTLFWIWRVVGFWVLGSRL